MCFSAEADIVAGSIVSVVGIDALCQVREPKELALGSLPLLLGTHLLVEAAVWGDLTDAVSPGVGRQALWVYLLFALVLLPVLVPAALWAIEPSPERRRLMAGALGLGMVVAGIYLFAMVRGPISAEIEGHHLVYNKDVPLGGWVAALYVVTACGPFLASSYRRVVAFGTLNIVAVTVLAWIAESGLTSLWCAWAAVTSVAISGHLRLAHRPPEPDEGSQGMVASGQGHTIGERRSHAEQAGERQEREAVRRPS